MRKTKNYVTLSNFKKMRIPVLIFCALLLAGCTNNSTKQNSEEQTFDSLTQEYLKRDSIDIVQFVKKSGNWHNIYLDSFIVEYRQRIHGYKVKAVLKPYDSDEMVLAANIYFTKNGKTFMVHSKSFGDTIFCKGRLSGEDGAKENLKTIKKYRNQTVKANYKATSTEGEVMLRHTPFFFQDLDFDGNPELVVVHQREAVRYHDGYDVYRIVEGKPILINYPPYYDKTNNGFGMTDYPIFDFKRKTITCPLAEGEIRNWGYALYGIGKKKDVVVVNGRKHYFNKIVKIYTKEEHPVNE